MKSEVRNEQPLSACCGATITSLGLCSDCSENVTGEPIRPSRETIGERSRTHGAAVGRKRTPEYRAYLSAKNRCSNPNNENFENYGGRGIEFHFSSFEEFLAHVGPRPTKEHSMDRIENDGHYAVGNVHWATKEEQALNRRDALTLTFLGRTQNASVWAKELSLSRTLINGRRARGWCDACTLTIPPVVGGLGNIGGRSACPHIEPIIQTPEMVEDFLSNRRFSDKQGQYHIVDGHIITDGPAEPISKVRAAYGASLGCALLVVLLVWMFAAAIDGDAGFGTGPDDAVVGGVR